MDAKKERIGPARALDLAREMTDVYVAKGKKVVHFAMREDPPKDEELSAAIIGPSGNLRAPTIQKGKRLFVGYSEEAYREHFG